MHERVYKHFTPPYERALSLQGSGYPKHLGRLPSGEYALAQDQEEFSRCVHVASDHPQFFSARGRAVVALSAKFERNCLSGRSDAQEG